MMALFMTCARAIRVGILLALLQALPGQMRSYLKMEVDPGNGIVRLSDEVPITRGSPNLEFFQQVTQQFRQRIRSFVYRMAPIGGGQSNALTEAFDVNEDGILVGRRKFQEIFRGSFGVLLAESSYQYPGPEYGVGSIGFSLRAGRSSIHGEVPRIIEELPSSATPLHSITVIRISKLEGVDLAARG
jgi:hypothetical protein